MWLAARRVNMRSNGDPPGVGATLSALVRATVAALCAAAFALLLLSIGPVSYTHLTLPTNREV